MRDMTTFDSYCWQLKQALARSGRSRGEIAAELGVEVATLKSWVTGRRSPTVRTLLQLARVLQADPRSLFDRPEAVPAPRTCPACGRSFREERYYRIHLSLRAKACPEHERLASSGAR